MAFCTGKFGGRIYRYTPRNGKTGQHLHAAHCRWGKLQKIDHLTNGNLLAQYPEMDWKGVKGLRDIISHHYFDVDAEEIFLICSEQIPILNETIRKIATAIEAS